MVGDTAWQRQRGFTLTEMMVSMAIGMIIVLGAGHLFLGTLITQRHVDELSRQQEALIFAVATMTATLRQHGPYDASGQAFYHLRCQPIAEACRCTLQDMSRSQPMVNFSIPLTSACERDEALGRQAAGAADSLVTLPLGPEGSELSFHVTQREGLLARSGE